jgi:hypothetical protein
MLVNYRKVRKHHSPTDNGPNNANANVTPPTAEDTIPAEDSHPEADAHPTSDANNQEKEKNPSHRVAPTRPRMRKAVTAQGLAASAREKERAQLLSSPSRSPTKDTPKPVHDDEEQNASGEDTEDAEQEQPVVQLDSNPHILPGWMLRGRREYYRSLPSNVVAPRSVGALSALGPEDRNPLKRLKDLGVCLERGAISNPELANGGGTPGRKFLFLYLAVD